MKTPQAPPLKERHLRFLLSYGPGIIYALDSVDFTVTFISENVTELVGYQVAQFLASGFWLTKVHPKDLPLVDDAFKALRAEGRHTYEYRFLHSDGTYHWMYDAMRLMPGAGGQLAEVFGVWLDITPQRRAQEELRAAEARLAQGFDTTPDAVVMTNLDHTLVYLNGSARSLFGIGAEDDLASRRFFGFQPAWAAQNVAEHGLPMALAAGVWTGESAILTSAGREIPVLLQILLHSGTRPEEQMLSFIARDISEIKRVEAELRKAKDEAERANRAKSEFLSNMSHELRTPLTSILGFSELLADGSCGEVNDQQELYLENIQTSGRDLLGLVNDLLDLVKIEAGRIDLELVDVQVGPFIADIVDAMQAMAAKAGLALTHHLEPSLPEVRVDPRRFKQMLLNLLSNAIKFTPGGGRVDVHVQVKKTIQPRGSVKIPGTWLAIAVTDSGVGIALEDLDRLFLAFEQVAGKQPAARPGTGLGLALTRRLARYHGGHVWVESAGLNRGSTFVLALPVHHTGEEQSP